MKILVITDNDFLYNNFIEIVSLLKLADRYNFSYRYSFNNKYFSKQYFNYDNFKPINLKNKLEVDIVMSNFSLVISLHCKQLFPSQLVKAVRCINVHPGFNPYNRGWFPQVFSIINMRLNLNM